jgi:hypothetical protein
MKLNTLIKTAALGLTALNTLSGQHHELLGSLPLSCNHKLEENWDVNFQLAALMDQIPLSGVAPRLCDFKIR